MVTSTVMGSCHHDNAEGMLLGFQGQRQPPGPPPPVPRPPGCPGVGTAWHGLARGAALYQWWGASGDHRAVGQVTRLKGPPLEDLALEAHPQSFRALGTRGISVGNLT